jgi:hypothetical protein
MTRFPKKIISVAYTPDQLANDTGDELWEVELDRPFARRFSTGAKRGRLLNRIETWTAETAEDFANGCRIRTEEFAVRAKTDAFLVQPASVQPRLDQLFQDEVSKGLLESFLESEAQDTVGPKPPVTPEGMDLADSGASGGRRGAVLQDVQALLSHYCEQNASAGAFWLAVAANRHLHWLTGDSDREDLGIFRKADFAADAAARAAREAALAEAFSQLAREPGRQVDWLGVTSEAWGMEKAQQSRTLLDLLGLEG